MQSDSCAVFFACLVFVLFIAFLFCKERKKNLILNRWKTVPFFFFILFCLSIRNGNCQNVEKRKEFIFGIYDQSLLCCRWKQTISMRNYILKQNTETKDSKTCLDCGFFLFGVEWTFFRTIFQHACKEFYVYSAKWTRETKLMIRCK